MWVMGRPRSLKMALIDISYTTSAIVSVALLCTIFIARQHIDASRAILILQICPSVCMSVRNVPVSDENGLTYRHSFFNRTVAQSF